MKVDVLADTIELERTWILRDTQIREDRSIINLVKPEPKEGEVRWVMNDPKTLYETSVSLMSSYPPRIRLPLSFNFDASEKTKMSKVERFVLGILRNLDHSNRARGGSSWLRDLAYWVCSGWYSVFVKVIQTDNGVKFVADIFDPITVYPQWDSEKLIKLSRTYSVEAHIALTMAESFGIKDFYVKNPHDLVKIINYWADDDSKIYNSIYLGDKEVKPLQLVKGCKRIPILVGTVGIPDYISPGWEKRKGENIIATNRDMYDHQNKVISLMTQAIAETVIPNKISISDSGEPVVKASDLKGYGGIIPLRTGEDLKAFLHANVPQSTGELLQLVDARQQRGGLPYVVYGGVPFELSGFAISQLMAAIRYKISPYINAMQSLIGDIAVEIINQFREYDSKPVRLMTTDPRGFNKGMFFVEEFKKADIPEVTFIEVTIPLTSALDKTQQIMFARQAMSPPQMLSRETLWDEVLEVQDPEQEYARIIQDQTLEMPIVKTIAIIEGLRKLADSYKEQGKSRESQALQKHIQLLEMQAGLRQGMLESPGQGGQPGVSPQTMPPEMGTGGVNPDMLRSILGQAPPSPNRPKGA